MKKRLECLKKCMLHVIRTTIAMALISGFAQQVYAQSFVDGMEAYGKEDYTIAVQIFTPLAEKGHLDAQFALGVMYSNSLGVDLNYTESAKWHRMAAKQGKAYSQYMLGVMYGLGQGVEQSYVEAAKWHRMAAEQGYVDSQYELGFLYVKGQGVVKDYTYAYMWWNISAARGHLEAKSYRDKVEKNMATNDISKAQTLASECVKKKYKGC